MNQVQNLAIAKRKLNFEIEIVFNSILTAAYEFKTDVCTHALSCNARLSAIWYYNGHADAKLAVLLFTHLPHACKTQCVDYSISTREQGCTTV